MQDSPLKTNTKEKYFNMINKNLEYDKYKISSKHGIQGGITSHGISESDMISTSIQHIQNYP
jgi:hypothetical protein